MHSIRFACFWPGLLAAWHQGKPRGLFFSVLFAWALSLLLLATFVWPHWFGRWIVVTGWLTIACYWLVETIRTQLKMAGFPAPSGADPDELFQAAQQDYLRGNWFEAEAKLLEILQRVADDVPAMLLLVGVLRHTQRFKTAVRKLDQLVLLDAAAGWQFEILKEKQLIQQAMSQAAKAADSDSLTSPQVA